MDVATLREREDVPVETETIELSPEAYDPEDPGRDEGDRAAAVVVYDDRGRVLLTRDADWDGWVFPGGMIEHGERLLAGARREAREETGLEPAIVGAIRLIDQRFVCEPVGEVGRLPFVLLEGHATGDPGDPAELGEPDETIHDVGWFESVPEDTPRAEEIARLLERGPTRDGDR